tara:strand:- start:1233 stop:1850 length:618 start_codon:yes stop_codon:yes gene_type:complete
MQNQTSKVRVSPDDQGNVIRVSKNNPEYGCIRLEQQRVSFNTQGWVNNKKLSCLIHGKVEDLQSLAFDAETELPGKIVVREQLSPFSGKDPDRDLKIAGDTGVVCCKYGEPIYRKSFYVTNEDESDIFIAHTNTEDIQNANGGSKGQLSQSELDEIMTKSDKKKSKAEKESEVTMEDIKENDSKEEVIEEPQEEEVEMENETFEL